MKDRPPTSAGREPPQAGAARGADDPVARQGSREVGTAGAPTVTRVEDGYEVIEQSAGHAVGQWLLLVRCQCGHNWFELEEVESTHCPSCGLMVYLDFQD